MLIKFIVIKYQQIYINWTIGQSQTVFVQLQYIFHAEFVGIEYMFGQFDIAVQFKMYTSYVYMTRKHSSDLIKRRTT